MHPFFALWVWMFVSQHFAQRMLLSAF